MVLLTRGVGGRKEGRKREVKRGTFRNCCVLQTVAADGVVRERIYKFHQIVGRGRAKSACHKPEMK